MTQCRICFGGKSDEQVDVDVSNGGLDYGRPLIGRGAEGGWEELRVRDGVRGRTVEGREGAPLRQPRRRRGGRRATRRWRV